ncbi:MAG: SRPBCC family protein [Proteobacteria bacterium]|nr:SRPBCC family protein [Pseudomonadota bacterium]
MEIEKTLNVAAAPQQVWELLLDPQVMGGCVPGMQSIDVVSPTEYVALMHVKIAFVSARFKLRTNIVEQRAPDYLRAEGTGEDASVASSLKQRSEIFLTPLADGGTELRIKVNVDVLGRLGTFGLSVMKTKADRMWEEFGNNLRARMDATATATATASGPAPAAGAQSAKPAAAPAARTAEQPAPPAAASQRAPAPAPSPVAAAAPPSPAATPLASMPPPVAAPAPAASSWWSRVLGHGAAPAPGRFIHIELRQGGTTIRVDWPLEGADQCQAWLRELASAR